MSTKLKIYQLITEIAAAQGKKIAPLSDDLVLMKSGLDSLCFAILVARMEDEVGFDPFTSSEEAQFPNTLGDLIKSYDSHAIAA